MGWTSTSLTLQHHGRTGAWLRQDSKAPLPAVGVVEDRSNRLCTRPLPPIFQLRWHRNTAEASKAVDRELVGDHIARTGRCAGGDDVRSTVGGGGKFARDAVKGRVLFFEFGDAGHADECAHYCRLGLFERALRGHRDLGFA